jgi:hypothetical protein
MRVENPRFFCFGSQFFPPTMQDGLAAMQVEIRGWKIHTHDAQSYTISGCSSTTDLTRDFDRLIDPSRVAVVICILVYV